MTMMMMIVSIKHERKVSPIDIYINKLLIDSVCTLVIYGHIDVLYWFMFMTPHK